MDLDAQYLLPEGVVLASVNELPGKMLGKLSFLPGDYAIGQKHGRSRAKILSSEAGALLNKFRSPVALIDAVIDLSKESGEDPERVLENAYPLLSQMIAEEFLVPTTSELVKQTVASYVPGEKFREFEIIQCVHLLGDTEVFLATSPEGTKVALKLARAGYGYMDRLIENEARILRLLERDEISPCVIDTGVSEGRSYLVTDWIEGMPLNEAIDNLRETSAYTVVGWAAYDLACQITRVYARLHERGVLHTDVHPRNAIVRSDGTVALIDFAHSSLQSEKWSSDARVAEYSEPEFAQAVYKSRKIPNRNARGEQYSVAVMVFETLTSKHIADGKYFVSNYDESDTWRKIAQEKPLPLTTYFNTCPESVASVVYRALSKKASQRFSSLRAFDSSLSLSVRGAKLVVAEEDVAITASVKASTTKTLNLPYVTGRVASQRIQREFLGLAAPGGPWLSHVFENGPCCSINFGAAGVAYALYRIACVQQRPDILSLADVWSEQTFAHISSANAFGSDTIEISASEEGSVALYHGPTGVHCMRALLACARGDYQTLAYSVSAFTSAALAPCKNLDLTLGLSSLLIGASLLKENLNQQCWVSSHALDEAANLILDNIWKEVDQGGSVEEGNLVDYFGLAHGWAGIVYAALRWCAASGRVPPASVRQRLEELVPLGIESGPGIGWPYMKDIRSFGTSWCNGSTGWVYLWTEAHRAFGDPRYLTLAEKTAWNSWLASDNYPYLCCGSSGRAYSSMHMYNLTGDVEWLKRSRKLTELAIKHSGNGFSLYKSMTGVALLAFEIDTPEMMSMPMFDRER